MAACKVKVCRICCAMDCQLHRLHGNMKLYKAYEALTELALADEEDLPRYLCTSCADQLMNFARFRHRSLQANLMFLDILKNHGHISVESIQAVMKTKHSGPTEERTFSDFKTELKRDVILVDPIGIDISVDIKTEYISGDDEAVATCVEANDVVKDDAFVKISVNDNVDHGNLITGEDVLDKGLPSEQEDKLNMVGAREGREISKYLNRTEVNKLTTVKNKFLQNVKGDLCGYKNDSESKLSTLKTNAKSIHYCYMCDFKTESKKIVLAHMASHSGSKSLLSNVASSRIKNQRSHKKFLCDICKKSYSSRNGIQRHLLIHTEDRQYACDECNKSFRSKIGLKRHKILHTNNKKYKCDMCEKSYHQKGGLQYHLQTHVGDRPFACEVCNNSFTTLGTLKSHMLIHSGEKPHACDWCKKTFRQKSNLKSHLRHHLGHKPFACEICKKAFSRKFCLQNHILIHTGEKPFTCEVCNKSFCQKINYQRHVLKHLDKKPFNCQMCDKSFTQKYSYKMHVLTHSAVRPYMCDVCKTSFRTKSTLQSHMSTHSDSKPHSCYICEKSFRQKSSLRHHMIVHTALRPFSCEVCRKSFPEKGNLQRHMLTHNDVKPFSCDVCKTAFRQKSNLQSHLLRHWR